MSSTTWRAAWEGQAAAEPGGVPAPVLLEVDDLLGYLRHNRTLTGIQRVQVNIVRHLLSPAGPGRDARCGVICYDAEEGGFRELDTDLVRSLVGHCADGRIEHDRTAELLRRLDESGGPARLSAGQCYVVLNGFYMYRSMERYVRAKRLGLSVGVLLYDLIALSDPEFHGAELVGETALALGDGFAVFDFVLAISEFSAAEARRYAARHGLDPIPVEAVPLAHVVRDETGTPDAQADDAWTGALAPLRGRPFVLCVGTIEARKNHAYLLACWKLLLQEGVEPPDLVFAGRHGYRVDDLMDRLRATRYMDGRVHVLHDLSDGELGTLYRHCLFTAFPSFVEGWGLPVGESLAHGAPCVASGTSSIPEVGGDLVDYVDPYDVRDGVRVFRRMVVDGAYREGRRASILARFRARTWSEVAADLLARVAQLAPARPRPVRPPLLQAGEVFRISDVHVGRPVPPDYPARPLRLVLASGWRPVEDFGAWMRGREAVLRFATPCDEGTEVVLHLKFSSASHLDRVTVAISGDCGATPGAAPGARPGTQGFPGPALSTSVVLPVEGGAAFTATLAGRVGAEGVVEVSLRVEGNVPPSGEADRRCLSIAIERLAYAPRHDLAARGRLRDGFDR